MKVASWNIENLYHRDKALVRTSLSKNASDWILELDALMPRMQKSKNDMARIRELTFLLGFENIDTKPFGVLRKRNGELFLKQRDFANESKASRLTDWNGWIALQTVAVDHKSTLHKARLIAEIDADVLVLQEVEDRASLMAFNCMLKDFNSTPYEQVMVLDGNDDRGLSKAIMTKNGYRLDTVRCHNLTFSEGDTQAFEADCQEYAIITPKEKTVFILSTQLSPISEPKRKLQAREVAVIYDKLKVEGKEHLIVCGTLNDVSYSDCLSPILRETDLEDISRHSSCKAEKDKGKGTGYFRLGAYRMGVNIKQKDYMLLSHEMSQEILTCGIVRKAMWPERNIKWEVYPTLKNREQAASSHPMIWGEFDIS